jgi:hypothetical protein
MVTATPCPNLHFATGYVSIRRKIRGVEATGMILLKLSLAAVVFFSVSAQVCASTVSAVVNKGDLGVSLYDVGTSTEGKGDCNCAESLYGSRVTVSGFHKGYGEDVQPVIIIPAAAPATAEIVTVPMAKAIRKKLKRIAMKDGVATINGKAGRATSCVFGAPNASGCRQD